MNKHLLQIPSDMFPIPGDRAIEFLSQVLRPPLRESKYIEKTYAEKVAKMNQRIAELTQESTSKTLIELIEWGAITANSKHFFTPITSRPITPSEIVLSEQAFDEFCEFMTVKLEVLQSQKSKGGSSRKTTQQQEKDITARHREGESQNSLAKTYHVSRPTIKKIIQRNSRKASPLDGLGQR